MSFILPSKSHANINVVPLMPVSDGCWCLYTVERCWWLCCDAWSCLRCSSKAFHSENDAVMLTSTFISLETSEEIHFFQDIGFFEPLNHHQEHENKAERKAALLFACICGESLYMQSSNHQIYHQMWRPQFSPKHVNSLAFYAESA